MCLITRNKRVQTAKEDIIVYKELSKNLRAIFYNFQYKIGELYETQMTRLPLNSDMWTTFNSNDTEWCERNFPKWQSNPNNRKGMMCIAKGFHSAVSPEIFGKVNDSSLVECVIPKGAKFHTDETGLVVSNKLMVIKRL